MILYVFNIHNGAFVFPYQLYMDIKFFSTFHHVGKQGHNKINRRVLIVELFAVLSILEVVIMHNT